MKMFFVFLFTLFCWQSSFAHNHNKKSHHLKNEPQSQYQKLSSATNRIISISADDFNYAGSLTFSNDKAKKGKDSKTNDFKLYLNYAQNFDFLPQGMMGKATVRVQRENSDNAGGKSTNSLFGLGAGILHNLQADDVKNSIFLGAQGGLERQVIDNGTDDESGFNLFLFLEGGKRWDIGSYSTANISYTPSIEFKYTRYGGDIRDNFFTSGTDFRINFLKFDIHF